MPAPPLPPATGRLVGFLLMLSGLLLGLGLGLKVGLGVYSWYSPDVPDVGGGLLFLNLLGLLASGLLLRWGLQMRRGHAPAQRPDRDKTP